MRVFVLGSKKTYIHFMRTIQKKLLHGFSLIEMSVVVLLMSIFLTMGLGLMRAKMENAAWSETKLKQEKIELALIQFLRANGRLPCPNSGATLNGTETAPCLVNAGRGVVPWAALGLTRAEVLDGWGNFISYRVANRTPASASNWTITTGAAAFTLAELNVPLVGITIQERSNAGVITAITQNAVVALISHGKNGAGARTISGTTLAAPAGIDETANASPTGTTFVTRSPTEVAAATGGLYDDLVTYMTPQDVLQPLVDDKTLRARSTQQYRELAMQQVALISCTPPLAPPSFAAIQPTVGNGAIVYSCPGGVSYSCRSSTAITNATLPNKQLYQLTVFGVGPIDVTYANLQLAFPSISGRCP